jgi:hypothetical protein
MPAGRRVHHRPDHRDRSFIGLAAVSPAIGSIRYGARTCAARSWASSGWGSAPASMGAGSPSAPTRSGGSAPTSVATSPSWRTGPGPPSRPT